MYRLPKTYIDRFKSGEVIIETSTYRYAINARGQILRALKINIHIPDAWTVVYDLNNKEVY